MSAADLNGSARRFAAWAVVVVLVAGLLGVAGCAQPTELAPTQPPTPTSTPVPSGEATPPVVFAIIGDYGSCDSNERAVAELVASWEPAFVVTTGDDFYADRGGSRARNYRASTGEVYGTWLPSSETTRNAFFPSLGNHDYTDAGLETYLDYFDLPGAGNMSTSGSERYYDFVWGPVRFFILDSYALRKDANAATSAQATWLRDELAASKATWNVVIDHHPPYSSDNKHGSTAYMQWPFAEWGADAVVSGHAHVYERIERDGIVYFVNGLGGDTRYGFSGPVRGSTVRFSSDWGAQRITATSDELVFEFVDTGGTLRDDYRLQASPQ